MRTLCGVVLLLASSCFGVTPAGLDIPMLTDAGDFATRIEDGYEATLDAFGPKDNTFEPGDTDVFQGLLDFSFESSPELPADSLLPPPDVNTGCLANGDGVIDLSEFPAKQALGLVASYTANQPGTQVPVPNLGGKQQEDKTSYAWDFSAKIAGKDQVHYESILPLSSFWFDKHYPTGEFVQPFSAEYMGIYRLEDSGLHLLGIASAEEGQTVLSYAKPVLLLPLPLSSSMAWDADAVPAEGLYEGQSYPMDYGAAGKLSVTHSYSFLADKHGTAKVPAGSFPVQRVYLDLAMEVHNSLMPVPVAQKRVRIAYFVAECAGTVALVRSLEGETQKEFQWATEYKRLGF